MAAGLPNGGTQPSRGSDASQRGCVFHAEACLRPDPGLRRVAVPRRGARRHGERRGVVRRQDQRPAGQQGAPGAAGQRQPGVQGPRLGRRDGRRRPDLALDPLRRDHRRLAEARRERRHGRFGGRAPRRLRGVAPPLREPRRPGLHHRRDRDRHERQHDLRRRGVHGAHAGQAGPGDARSSRHRADGAEARRPQARRPQAAGTEAGRPEAGGRRRSGPGRSSGRRHPRPDAPGRAGGHPGRSG